MALKETLNANFKQLQEENKVNNAYLTGQISTEKKMVQQVKDMKRSTFDLSKFTVQGNPIITDDGIASGFSSGDYVRAYYEQKANTETRIKFRYIGSERQSSQQYSFIICGVTPAGSTNSLRLVSQSNGRFTFHGGATGADISTDLYEEKDRVYNFEFVSDGNNTLRLYNDGVLLGTQQNVAQAVFDRICIGTRWFENNQANGSIDIKQFSITVDGVEVFNGNKTGVDQIKKDDYTIVGSPTITDDGIASGFGSNNYLTNNLQAIGKKPFKIIIKFNSGIANTERTLLFLGSNSTDNRAYTRIRLHSDNRMHSWIKLENGTDIASALGNGVVPSNTDMMYKFEWNGSLYQTGVSYDDGNSWVQTKQYESSSPISTSNFTGIVIGTTTNVSNPQPHNGSIDLNSIKIYSDGNLVYQPCLKIPYTQSKTGSKIVDSIYRNRLEDCYNYQGYAPYYSLSDTDVTLPIGEVYGMKTYKSEVDGQWVSKFLAIVENAPSRTTVGTFDLSSYLPNDNNVYEILLTAHATTGNSSGNVSRVSVYSSVFNNALYLTGCITRTSSASVSNGGGMLPIGADKKLIVHGIDNNTGTYTLRALAYRRLGTNL